MRRFVLAHVACTDNLFNVQNEFQNLKTVANCAVCRYFFGIHSAVSICYFTYNRNNSARRLYLAILAPQVQTRITATDIKERRTFVQDTDRYAFVPQLLPLFCERTFVRGNL